MAIQWLDVRHGSGTPKQDVRVALSQKGDAVNISFKRGTWISKLHRADNIAVGFDDVNGLPIAIYFSMSSAGYRVGNVEGDKTPLIRIQARKLNQLYPRLKVSELQGDYLLKENKEQGVCYISLGAKSY